LDGQQNTMKDATHPQQLLSVPDGIFLVAGMVIGVGIFKLPGLVAGNAASAMQFFAAWIVGGVACLCGALVYAELASRYPETGGEYTFLRHGLGEGAGFVFAWSRMTVIQTGAIAAVSFVFGEYASQIVSFGAQSNAIWAAIGVAVLTALNFVGTLQSKALQKVDGGRAHHRLVLFALGGAGDRRHAAAGRGRRRLARRLRLRDDLRAARVRRLERGGLPGGRSARRPAATWCASWSGAWSRSPRSTCWSTSRYLAVLGHGGIKESKAVAADVMRAIAGERAPCCSRCIVCVRC
jgi:hypothetical protein